MFREMRRKKQALSPEQCAEILSRGTSGVLAVSGDDGWPYAVPLSYLYADGRLFFHCAQQGHKLDALARSEKASFCVIDRDEIVPEKYTTYFRSVIVFGSVREVTDGAEKLSALTALAEKYTPNDPDGCRKEAEGALGHVCVLALTPAHISGKQAIELAKKAGD